MSLLTIVQAHCQRVNISSPATVIGSQDPQIVQIRSILEEEGNLLSTRGVWENLQNQCTFNSIAAEDQGNINSLATNGFRYIVNYTFWDRTDRLPVLGPEDPPEWQALKAVVVTGPRYRYRIRQNKLLVNPPFPVDHEIAFEYISKNWITNSAGTSFYQYFAADDDETLLPEDLLILGLRWRWMKEKGLEYAELFRDYEALVKQYLGNDGGKKSLYLDNRDWDGPKPGIWVPDGNFPL